MDVLCTAEVCPVILNATCVFYEGDSLLYTGITTNDSLQTALQKIDAAFGDATVGYAFTNGVIQTVPGTPVKLGGSLIENTTIGGNFTLTFAGNVQAAKHITTGGTSSQFVKGDGTLDSTAYQAAGNYITALTGDVVASGPGSAVASLAAVNSNPGTYGSSTIVPIVTVDSKGRVTNITSTAVNVPSGILSFVGDVYGSGSTGSPTTLTLSNVNTNIYTVNTFLKFKVNAKGLVTGATPVSNLDVEAVLGYVPVPETRSITINGITHDLQTNVVFALPGGGTVQSVSVTQGTGISASVENPTTTPNITITNTLPDQVVTLTGQSGIDVTGTYPNFTISANEQGAVTNVTASSPLSSSGGQTPNISISQANTTTNGYLSSADWNTFNSKQPADHYITDLTGEATATGPGAATVTLSNSAVTGKLLTGINIAGGVITSADSILQAFGKVQNQINGLIGGTIFKGVWNAATNTPTLTSGIGTAGWYYITDVYGTTNLDGIAEWHVGDWAIFNGTTWEKVDNTDSVTSVNGYTGAVNLVSTDISEGTNLYYTNTRARQAISLTTTGTSGAATYNDSTGVINIPQYQGGVTSFNTRTGAITLTSTDVTNALSYTPVTDARTITINNVTYDLSTNRTWSIDSMVYPAAGIAVSTGTAWGTSIIDNSSNWNTAYSSRISSLTTTGNSGEATLVSNVLNIPNYTLAGLDGVPNSRTITINNVTYDLSADRSWTVGAGSSARNEETFTATANQTTFTVAGGYTGGLVDVYVNGVKLPPSDYTATNGTTVVLSTGVIVGDIVSVIKYTSSLYSLQATEPLSYNPTTSVLSISQADSSLDGYLSSTDWITFNNKLSTTSAASTYVPYTGATGPVNLGDYDLTVNGITVGMGSGGSFFNNTAIGASALGNNINGNGNTAIGRFSLLYNEGGSENTAIGYDSLAVNISGNQNTAIGYQALDSNTTGSQNTAIGYNSGSSITTGNYNTIVGRYAGTSTMESNVILSDGQGNIRFQWDGTSIKLNGNTVGSNAYTSTAFTPQARTLTINGTTYDLSANRTWTISAISSISGTSPISVSTISGASTISISQATTSTNGYLSSTNWNTFNSKEPAIASGTTAQYWRGDKTWQTLPVYTLSGLGGQPQLNGTGFVKVNGTLVSYDNSTYLTTTAAASSYLPYTGATGDVDLGTNKITTEGVVDTSLPVFTHNGGNVTFVGQTGGYTYINGTTITFTGITGALTVSDTFYPGGPFSSNVNNITNELYINSTSVPGFGGGITSILLPNLYVVIGNVIITNNSSALTTISFGSELKHISGNFNVTNNKLDQTSVDNILIRLAALDGTNGTTSYNNKTINLSGGTNSAPSSTGLAAKATLVSRGCTVTTN